MSRRRRARGAVVLVLTIALLAAGALGISSLLQRTGGVVNETCTATVGSDSYDLDPDQAANAALISAVSVKRGLPARAASIALATAIQESKLRNITYGDRDSLGLFQQRPSQGWGTAAQIKDPVYATNAFYDVLVKIQGYHDLPITAAAQEVQRSGYPQAYADHEPEGRAYASALTGQSPAALSCALRKATGTGSPKAVAASLDRAFGPLPASASGAGLTVTASDALGWAVAQWAVANAKELNITAVSFDGQNWSRADHKGWQKASAAANRVLITVAG